MKKKVYLTLSNGKVFEGYRFGATGEATGELVFTTGVVGYMETLTDPANYGNIVVQTFPLIGNYGAIRKDVESEKAWVSAFVVREICDAPSNFRSEGLLDDYLKEQGIVGLYGVDTRELTTIIRENGAMTATISSKKPTEATIKALAGYKAQDSLDKIACTQKTEHGNADAKCKVALWNFGVKQSVIDNLTARGFKVVSMPTASTAEEILAEKPDGIVIAGGAGNPDKHLKAIEEAKKLLGKKPIMGIEYGHLLIAVALGGKVKKQKYGHRGGNQPVKCLDCGRVYVTAQNHGYEVVASSVTEGRVKFINVNDNSVEGIVYPNYDAFTVSFAPEACDLGNTENPLYKKFYAQMKKEN